MTQTTSLIRTKAVIQATFGPSTHNAWALMDQCISLVQEVKTPALAELTVARRMRKQRGTPVFTTTNLKDAK
jgi:hypothetical protein